MSQMYNGQSKWGDGSTYAPSALQVQQRVQNHPSTGGLGTFSILGQNFTIPGLDAAAQAVADVLFGGGEIGVAVASLVGSDGAATPMALELAADGVIRLIHGVGSIITLENPKDGSTLTCTYPTTVPPTPVLPTPPLVQVPQSPVGISSWPDPWGSSSSSSAPTVADIVDGVMHTAEGAHGTSLATAMDTVAGNLDAPVSGVQTTADSILTSVTDIDTNGVWLKVAEETRLLARMFADIQPSGTITLSTGLDLISKDDGLIPLRGVGILPNFTLLTAWDGFPGPGGYPTLKYDTTLIDPTKTLAENLAAMNAGTTWTKGAQGLYKWEDSEFNTWGCLITDAQFVRDALGVVLTPTGLADVVTAILTTAVEPNAQTLTDLINRVWVWFQAFWASNAGGKNVPFTLQSLPVDASAAPSQALVYDVSALDNTLTLVANLESQNPGVAFTMVNGYAVCTGADGYSYVCTVSADEFEQDKHYMYLPASGAPKRSLWADMDVSFALLPVDWTARYPG